MIGIFLFVLVAVALFVGLVAYVVGYTKGRRDGIETGRRLPKSVLRTNVKRQVYEGIRND